MKNNNQNIESHHSSNRNKHNIDIENNNETLQNNEKNKPLKKINKENNNNNNNDNEIDESSDKDESESNEDMCSICLSHFETNDILKMLPCHHEFHIVCIETWLVERATCPMCRTNINNPTIQQQSQNNNNNNNNIQNNVQNFVELPV